MKKPTAPNSRLFHRTYDSCEESQVRLSFSTSNLAYHSYRSQTHLVRLTWIFSPKSRNRSALTEIRGCSKTIRLYA
jgi:hypothetical protein